MTIRFEDARGPRATLRAQPQMGQPSIGIDLQHIALRAPPGRQGLEGAQPVITDLEKPFESFSPSYLFTRMGSSHQAIEIPLGGFDRILFASFAGPIRTWRPC